MTDSDKLGLILEHASEYYKNGREYHFVKDGFVSYEFSEFNGKKLIYIADIFVSKEVRHGKTFPNLVHYCQELASRFGVDTAYASTEKTNPNFKSMDNMYSKVGFVKHGENHDNVYYKIDLNRG